MNEQIVRIRPIDTLLFRDARPFGNEEGALTARSLPVPMPGTIAGFLRTLIGNLVNQDWDALDEAGEHSDGIVRGPLLLRAECQEDGSWQEAFVLPAPADALVYEQGEQVRVVRLRPFPLNDGAGCDLPGRAFGLQPLQVSVDVKPASGYRFWHERDMLQWLSDAVENFAPAKVAEPLRDPRVHVAIDDATGVSQEGMLYTVEYRAFERFFLRLVSDQLTRYRDELVPYQEWSFVARVQFQGELTEIRGVGTLGGEKRLAYVEPYTRWLECPDMLKHALRGAQYVRMVLATPAIFRRGWLPSWLEEVAVNGSRALIGCPPTLESTGLKLRLISAAVPRRVPVSGWSLRRSTYGPKPTRWCAPAGSVYFFEVVEGDAQILGTDAWLLPVSDIDPHSESGARSWQSGYGLALWGIWTPVGGGS